MHRIDGTGATANNLFTEGNPTQGVPATVVDAEWLNGVQEEIANVIEEQGFTLTKGTQDQLYKAILKAGGTSVNSVSALRAGSYPTSLDRIWLSGYYGVGTPGGGPLYRDSADTATADNGGTVFVDADGVRWKRVVSDRLNLQWFGAKGDGATDDSAAIKAAIEAGAGDLVAGFNRSIYAPAGDYLIQESGVFSTKPSGSSAWGIVWHGDGWFQTRFLLDPPTAANAWFYDSAGVGVYVGCVFNDLCLRSSNLSGNEAFANGFNIEGTNGTGVGEGAFRFVNCQIGAHGGFRDWMNLTGTINAAEIKHIGCQFRGGTGRLLYQNNAQSVNIDFVSCDVVSHDGNVFEIERGGIINCYAGAWQWTSGWLVNLVNTDSAMATFVTFHNAKTEMRDLGAKLVSKTVDNDGYGEIVFNNCDMARGDGGSGPRVLVDIGERTAVRFNQCQLDSFTSPKSFVLREISGTSGVQQPPQIDFDRCRLADPEGFSDSFDFINEYGVVSARGCYSGQVGTSGKQVALDFDRNWQNSFVYSRSPEKKVAILKDKQDPWPSSGTAREYTMVLPVGAIITGYKVYKPAAGGSGADYQLVISNDDQTTIYASGPLDQEKFDHVIDVDLGVSNYIHVGTSLNDRTLRLYDNASGGETISAIPGEMAIVEYI